MGTPVRYPSVPGTHQTGGVRGSIGAVLSEIPGQTRLALYAARRTGQWPAGSAPDGPTGRLDATPVRRASVWPAGARGARGLQWHAVFNCPGRILTAPCLAVARTPRTASRTTATITATPAGQVRKATGSSSGPEPNAARPASGPAMAAGHASAPSRAVFYKTATRPSCTAPEQARSRREAKRRRQRLWRHVCFWQGT